VFDVGQDYEFEIIKGDDGDGSLTLSIRKIQVRFARTDPTRRGEIALDPERAKRGGALLDFFFFFFRRGLGLMKETPNPHPSRLTLPDTLPPDPRNDSSKRRGIDAETCKPTTRL
jgi:hypothetical protein